MIRDSKLKVISVVGARPQFIKAAMISRAVQKKYSSGIQEKILHTGQHYDWRMSGIFFKNLGLSKPDYNLGIGSHRHGKQTGLMLEAVEKILIRGKPDLVLVYGDTNSTLSGALAASKLHIPVAHIEAGMRSFNKSMPEEMNRIVVDHVSDILFCSSKTAVRNLYREGIASRGGSRPHVVRVGDVMLDALKVFAQKASLKSSVLRRFSLKRKDYFLATIHRAENTNDPEKLKIIFESFNEIAQSGSKIILPLHPRTRECLRQLKLKKFSEHFRCVEPVSYLDMLMLEKNAAGILTDSGGVQKEAYFFGVPALTLRDETEWVETLERGLNTLVPIEKRKIRNAFRNRLGTYPNLSPARPYGDGKAAERISDYLASIQF